MDVICEKRSVFRSLTFFDGQWHDQNGNPISIPPEQEKGIISKISRIEAANYASMPEMIQLDDAKNMADIADYLQCPLGRAFVFYSDISTVEEFVSPSTDIPDLRGTFYMLASVNSSNGINWVEIADLCGNIANPMATIGLFRQFIGWAKRNNVGLIGASCRESTSNRLFADGSASMNMFIKNGYVKLPIPEADRSYNMMTAGDDEVFHINVVVSKDLLDNYGAEEIWKHARHMF